jgi:hypothetical protein
MMADLSGKLRLLLALVLFRFRSVFNRLGVSFDFSEAVNVYYRSEFNRVPLSEKAVVLPHCLTGDKCPARFSKDEGVICMKCMQCRCGEIHKLCEELGWQFYISPSANFTRRLAQRKKIGAAIGVACDYEIERGIKSTRITGNGVHLNGRRLIPQVIMAARFDCMNNDADWEKLKRMIISGAKGAL